jgi:hypothetical protein
MSDNFEKEEFLSMVNEGKTIETPIVETTTTETPIVENTETTTTTTETPIVEQATTQTPETTSLTESQKIQALNEILGTEYTSLQEAIDAKSRLGEYASLKETKDKYEELSKTPIAKFANKSVEEFNAFVEATNIDDAQVYKSIKSFSAKESKDPIEAMVLAEVIKDPSLLGKEHLIKKQFERKFNTYIDPDLYGEELEQAKEEAELTQFNLEREGKKAEQEISNILEKVNTNSKKETITDIQQQKHELKAQWESVIVKDVDKIFKTIPVTVPKGKDANGQEIFEQVESIELSPADSLKYANEAVKELVESGKELSSENLIQAVAKKHREILADNYHIVTSKIHAKAQAEARLSKEKEIHNPSGAGKIQTPGTETPKDFGTRVLEKLEQEG